MLFRRDNLLLCIHVSCLFHCSHFQLNFSFYEEFLTVNYKDYKFRLKIASQTVNKYFLSGGKRKSRKGWLVQKALDIAPKTGINQIIR